MKVIKSKSLNIALLLFLITNSCCMQAFRPMQIIKKGLTTLKTLVKSKNLLKFKTKAKPFNKPFSKSAKIFFGIIIINSSLLFLMFLQKKFRDTVVSNDIAKIKSILFYLPNFIKKILISSSYYRGQTLLHKACEDNNLEIVKLLLPHCTKKIINKPYSIIFRPKTPLFLACKNNNIEIIKLLLPYYTKETINICNPLFEACKNNNLKIVKLLLTHCEKRDLINQYESRHNNTPLSLACNNGNFKLVKLLLPHCEKETINYKDKPLRFSCEDNNLDIVKLLIEHGANIDEESKREAQKHPEIKKYINSILSLTTKKIKTELNEELRNSLIKVAFGKFVHNCKNNSHETSIFEKLYKDESINLEKTFGVSKKDSIFDFVKDVFKNKKNRYFVLDKSFLRKRSFFEKLNINRNNSKFRDCVINTVE